MVDGGVNRWCILATSKTHPRMSPRGSEFREPQGYLPGPLPANKWSRRTTMMNCEFGSSPVCLQLPASVPACSGAAAAAVMLNQLKVTAGSAHIPGPPVATAVQIRRAEEGSPGGFTVGGGRVPWAGGGGESETPPPPLPPSGSGGGRGAETPSSCPVQNTPHGAFAWQKVQVPADDAQAPSPYLNKPIKHLFSEVLVLEESRLRTLGILTATRMVLEHPLAQVT